MPSFLSKVFGRKKQDDKDARSPPKRVSDPSLLEGKFEAVSHNISPVATNFAQVSPQPKETRDGDGGFSGLFRPKSRMMFPHNSPSQTTADEFPHLSLNLPGPKEESSSRALGIVFEADPADRIILDDAVIGARRLNPLEALILVRVCSQAIVSRGLESLGIMHPHWYSASSDVQRKLISLFIQSLAPKSPITTLSPTPSAPVSAFESEISFTRSPHDVAAVLRWGLRHLKLEGTSLGKDPEWYRKFSDAERSASYPPKAFTTFLTPLLPPSHVELLLAILEVISYLAAHAENNGISGSKLTKFLGFWLLTVDRTEGANDWASFYARWERMGRILEHLFLARIRDESLKHRMPTRLLELINHYPYSGKSAPHDGEFITRPRFSTRQYPTIFVRIETELPSQTSTAPVNHPLQIIIDAFKADVAGEQEQSTTWDSIKNASSDSSSESPSHPVLSRIFADETVRLLSLVPVENSTDADAPATLSLPETPKPTRRRSFSLNDANPSTSESKPNGTISHSKSATTSPPPSSFHPTDWVQFSTTGFGDSNQPLAATLLDKDVEITSPVRKTSRRRKAASRRSSTDNLIPPTVNKPEDRAKLISRATHVTLVQLDEAFIDFWSDALLDPISDSFPAFVICKLLPQISASSSAEHREPVSWLVIEQKFTYPAPPVPPSAALARSESHEKARANSPKPSLRSDMSALRIGSTLSSARKRFSFFSGSKTNLGDKEKTKAKTSGDKSVKIGEMGEILSGDASKGESVSSETAKKDVGVHGAGLGISGASAAVSAAAAAGAVATVKALDKTDLEVKPTSVLERNSITVQPIIEETPEVTQTPPAEIPEPESTPKDESNEPRSPDVLPPAPASVVLAGDTPGPQLVLNTSESAATAQIQPQVTTSQDHSSAVDLEPVPIVQTTPPTNGPVVTLSDVEEAKPEEQVPAAVETPELQHLDTQLDRDDSTLSEDEIPNVEQASTTGDHESNAAADSPTLGNTEALPEPQIEVEPTSEPAVPVEEPARIDDGPAASSSLLVEPEAPSNGHAAVAEEEAKLLEEATLGDEPVASDDAEPSLTIKDTPEPPHTSEVADNQKVDTQPEVDLPTTVPSTESHPADTPDTS